jgi:hypothetical protein
MRGRAVVLAAAIVMAPLGARGADLMAWWNEGYYAEEDAAIREIIAAFERETGKKVELVFQSTEEPNSTSRKARMRSAGRGCPATPFATTRRGSSSRPRLHANFLRTLALLEEVEYWSREAGQDRRQDRGHGRYIGWDVVLADDGIWILEANSRTNVKPFSSARPPLTDPRVVDFYCRHGVLRGRRGRLPTPELVLPGNAALATTRIQATPPSQ